MADIITMDKEAFLKLENALTVAEFMLHPENQPPQYSIEKALGIITEAQSLLAMISPETSGKK